MTIVDFFSPEKLRLKMDPTKCLENYLKTIETFSPLDENYKSDYDKMYAKKA